MHTSLLPQTLCLDLKTMNQYGIWTGGAKAGKMTSVNATSLLGGLRFWTESLLVAQGREVCQKSDSCPRSKEEEAEGKKKICDACMLWGCTGLSRAFSMRVFAPGKIQNKSELCIINKNGEDRKYLFRWGYQGMLQIVLAPRRPSLDNKLFEIPREVVAALFLQIQYGTLGAYDQYGCGLVAFDNEEQLSQLRHQARSCPATVEDKEPSGLSLKDFFFFKGQITGKPKSIQTMAEIRYDIRVALHVDDVNAHLRHWFCGHLPQDKTRNDNKDNINYGSNYVFSIDQQGNLYGWGHFARAGVKKDFLEKRERVVSIVHNKLKQLLGPSLVWKEFSAPDRDAASPKEWPAYFESMINTPWRTLP